MSALLISNEGDDWFAIGNQGRLRYQFLGTGYSGQLASVNRLSAAMQAGQQAVASQLDQALDLEGDSVQGAINMLFAANEEMAISPYTLFYTAKKAKSLWDEIKAVGKAFAKVLEVF